jgi:predicted N-acetyltransferase YhbS
LSIVTEIPTPARAGGRPGAQQSATGSGANGVLLRELADADLPAVVRLCAEALDLPEDAAESAEIIARLRDRPADRHAIGFVALDATQVTGAADESPPADGASLAGVVLASLSHRDPTLGHLDLVAVHPRLRRRGIGRALLLAAENALAGRGAVEVLIAGNMPYGWPGIDVRYTPALCAAMALGYEQDSAAWNMTAELTPGSPALRDTGPALARLASGEITVRRAGSADLPALDTFIRANFTTGWAWEVRQSIGRDRAGCHIALRESTGPGSGEPEVLGFAAYGALRPSWFGPMGTAPSAQGLGIGGVLLRRCLADLHAAGYDRAQIGWVGPVPFYSGAVGAYIERVFFLYRKEL